jgi:ketosteroid isomerase-like protein
VTVSPAQQALLQDVFAAIDRRDADGFVTYLTADAVFRFGSAPPVKGRDAAREAVAGFFGTIKGLSHELSRSMAAENVLICEGEVTYTRHDGSTVTLPFADSFELDDGFISHYKIYMDIGPLYAE